MEKNINKNKCLYFMEGAACISVVFLHCKFPSWLGVLVCGLCRFAVPLFFLVSGYYLYCPGMSNENMLERIHNKISRFASVLLTSSILYFFWTMFCGISEQGREFIFRWFHELFQPKCLFSTIILNDFSVIGGHLWFLAALLYCYIMLFAVLRLDYVQRLLKSAGGKLSAMLLGMHISGRILFALCDIDQMLGIHVYIWFRNWLFMAFPFLIAGYWIRQNEERILKSVCIKHLVLLFTVGVLMTTAENVVIYKLTGDDRELYLGTFLMVFSMFLYALYAPGCTGVRWIENIGRYYLLFIYIAHLVVIEGINMLLTAAGLDHARLINCIKPLIVVVITGYAAVFQKHFIDRRRVRKK